MHEYVYIHRLSCLKRKIKAVLKQATNKSIFSISKAIQDNTNQDCGFLDKYPFSKNQSLVNQVISINFI